MVAKEDHIQESLEIEMPAEPVAPEVQKKSGPRRTVMLAVVSVLALGALFKAYQAYSFGLTHVDTDNAYVTGDLVNISPIVSGTLAELNVSDGEFVHKGKLIAKLNQDSPAALLAQAQANLQVAEDQVPQAEAQLQFTQLSTEASIQSSKAALDSQSARTQGSRMQVRLSSDTVHSQVLQAQGQVEAAEAQASQAHSLIEEAKAALANAKLAVVTAKSNSAAAVAAETSQKAEATRADKDLRRYRSLFNSEAVSEQQLDSATAVASSSAANYEAASRKSEAARSQVEEANSVVVEAERRVATAIEQAKATDKQVAVAKAGLSLALAGNAQVGIQGTNVQTNLSQGAQADAELASAQAGTQQVTLRQKQLEAARAQLNQARAAVENAKVQVRDTSLYAPCDGYVVKHSANVGSAINPGQTIATITRGKDVWVMANFKETQLDKVEEGQPVEISVDAYPGRKFYGKVVSILQATGSATTLLPPDNSTGNFTKVVQRVPVKISIEGEQASRLRQGMSVDATIDTSRSASASRS
jgi:membrane fusion protein (multidrug efflux system)